MATGQRHVFLSAELAGPGERRFARVVVALALLAFIATVPFAQMPSARIPPFSPGYEAALWIVNTLTAVLLFSQFARLRGCALLLLAAGYMFNALIVIPHALSFPGVLSATGLLGAGPQTTAWLYVFWHAGFPLSVLAYAWQLRDPTAFVTVSAGSAILVTMLCVILAASALSVLATAGHDLLPVLIHDGTYAPLFMRGLTPAMVGLSLCALLVLWRRSLPTLLELWVMVTLVAWGIDIALSGMISNNRFEVGFYAGRLFSLFAATVVLAALLFEMNRLYARVADALALAEMRNAELARSREQFARVQRFEAIGQLVGGVAHDFNNLLTVITGALDLTLREPSLPPKTRSLLDMSMAAAHRGARLTGQLLTFARKQMLQLQVLNPNEVVANLETFIARSTGERIDVVTELSAVLWPVRLDRSQFETALINLVVNARDALNGEGRIVIRTRNASLDDKAFSEVPAGDYVVVSVSDAGPGMAPDVVARAVEPFFTTKGVGKGSGLGLSQVFGFVRAASGHLRIDSRLGEGTTVEFYVPKTTEPTQAAKPFDLVSVHAVAAGETILVVEDDPAVLTVAVSGLLDLGYQVRIAMSAQEAMAVLRGDTAIDILFSDVVMPGGMNGAQLAREARRIRPRLKVLLTSGYAASALAEDHGLPSGELPDGLDILPKPYRRQELANKLRLVIGG